MQCPICEKTGKISNVMSVGSTSTIASTQEFFDEFKRYHFHNPKVVTHNFQCSNGHSFVSRNTTGCIACNKPSTIDIYYEIDESSS